MWSRRVVQLVLLGALTVAPASFAGGDMDFQREATRRMKLSFDLDEVAELIEADDEQIIASPMRAPLPLEPNSDVEEVTVFRDRALVTRVLSERLEKGTQTIVFEGLPLGIEASSVHAVLRGGNARIIGVEKVSGSGDVEETERVEKIREEMKGIAEDLGQVRDRIESLLAQRSYLRTTLLRPSTGDHPTPRLDEVKGVIEYIGDSERRIAAELRKEEEKARELDEELSPLLVKLANPLATGQTVRVDLEVERLATVVVALRYQVRGASWTPSYNARFNTEKSQVILEYYGIVTQNTGELWEGVSLNLSTGNPSISGTLPQISSWYLGRDGGYNVLGNLEQGRGHYDTPMNAMNSPFDEEPAGVVESTLSANVQGAGPVVFAIQGDRTLDGDGSQSRIPVGTQTFGLVSELTSAPKLVPEVYRRGRIRYQGEIPLLPGQVATYVGSDYVGSASLPTVVPGEDFTLSFGVDESVKVSRLLQSRQKEHVNRKTIRYTFHFRIKVHNFGKEVRKVQVVDQVPISEIDRVTVKVLETTESLPHDVRDGPGILKWMLNIEPGTEKVIDLKFQVTAPEDVYLPDVAF